MDLSTLKEHTNLHPVKSSNIAKVGYNEDKKVLLIQFYSGTIYAYLPITQEGYLSLIKAESLGKYFYSHIKNNPDLECIPLGDID